MISLPMTLAWQHACNDQNIYIYGTFECLCSTSIHATDSVWFYAYEHTVLRTLMCGVFAVTPGDYT